MKEFIQKLAQLDQDAKFIIEFNSKVKKDYGSIIIKNLSKLKNYQNFEILTKIFTFHNFVLNFHVCKIGCKFELWIGLNPYRGFREIINQADSVIFASGTLKPIEDFLYLRGKLFKIFTVDKTLKYMFRI